MPVYADTDTGIVKIRLAAHFVERDRYFQRFFSHPSRKQLRFVYRCEGSQPVNLGRISDVQPLYF
jgi:hypothetical protein